MHMYKATYKRVLIGVVHATFAYIYKGGCRGNTGQLDEDLMMVRDIDQFIKRGDTSLVSRIG